MKNLNIISFIILLFLNSNFVFAQSNLELKYERQTIELQHLSVQLDSLNLDLQNQVDLIDSEKLKNNRDEDKITDLLADTATLTNTIDEIRREMNELIENIDETKSELYKEYSIKIDSLKTTESFTNKSNIEIIKLTEKRLLVSPKINILSFSPQNVLEIKASSDTIQQKIYYEYLNEAFVEVSVKMNEIALLKEEIQNILELNQETKEFLEDIDFDNNFAVYSNPNNSDRNLDYSSDFREDIISDNEKAALNTVNTQSKSFSDMLFQFGLTETYNTDTYLNSNNNSTVKNLKDFKKLIETVEKQLTDYKTIISNKLKGS